MKCFGIVIAVIVNVCAFLNATNNGLHGTPTQNNHLEGRIVNGVVTPIAMYPYFALILKNYRVHCGGCIISSRVVLTAAHCLYHAKNVLPGRELQAQLGASTVSEGTIYDACECYPHEKYNFSMQYDIGLILLSKTIKFGYKVQRAKLINNKSWRNIAKRLATIGYGMTEVENRPPDVLRMTVMKYISNELCDRSQHGQTINFRVPSNMFCLIGDGWTSDCYGDSGAPVSWRGYVVGIVNTGRDFFCGSDMMPSMYLDVSHFTVWIKSIASKLKFKSFYCDIK